MGVCVVCVCLVCVCVCLVVLVPVAFATQPRGMHTLPFTTCHSRPPPKAAHASEPASQPSARTRTVEHGRRQLLRQQRPVRAPKRLQQQPERRLLQQVDGHVCGHGHARVDGVHEVRVPHEVRPVVAVPACACVRVARACACWVRARVARGEGCGGLRLQGVQVCVCVCGWVSGGVSADAPLHAEGPGGAQSHSAAFACPRLPKKHGQHTHVWCSARRHSALR
jgi:hypothetical protein